MIFTLPSQHVKNILQGNMLWKIWSLHNNNTIYWSTNLQTLCISDRNQSIVKVSWTPSGAVTQMTEHYAVIMLEGEELKYIKINQV